MPHDPRFDALRAGREAHIQEVSAQGPARLQQGAILIDVREIDECETQHAAGAASSKRRRRIKDRKAGARHSGGTRLLQRRWESFGACRGEFGIRKCSLDGRRLSRTERSGFSQGIPSAQLIYSHRRRLPHEVNHQLAPPPSRQPSRSPCPGRFREFRINGKLPRRIMRSSWHFICSGVADLIREDLDMKAVCWHGRSDVRIDTVPDPKLESPQTPDPSHCDRDLRQ